MCYYNGVRVSKSTLIKLGEIEKVYPFDFVRPVQSGFDYREWPIIRPAENNDWELTLAHWELLPFWIQSRAQLEEQRKKMTTLNATAEKLLDSKLFRNSALKRRCLVLSTGFYEWRHYKPAGSKKDIAYPYHITLKGQEYFFMAGIWQPWTDQETGEMLETFAIVTTEANELMSEVHNKKKRMPTILPEKEACEWLQKDLPEERIRQLAAFQFPADKMNAYTIPREFRAIENPGEQFEYAELPAIGSDGNVISGQGSLF